MKQEQQVQDSNNDIVMELIKTEELTFSQALYMLKNGSNIARAAWNKEVFIWMAKGKFDYLAQPEIAPNQIQGIPASLFEIGLLGSLVNMPRLDKYTEQETIISGVTLGAEDLLAEDWYIR